MCLRGCLRAFVCLSASLSVSGVFVRGLVNSFFLCLCLCVCLFVYLFVCFCVVVCLSAWLVRLSGLLVCLLVRVCLSLAVCFVRMSVCAFV